MESQEEGHSPVGGRSGAEELGFLSSTQMEGHKEATIFGSKTRRAISPIGPRSRGRSASKPRFIVDLYLIVIVPTSSREISGPVRVGRAKIEHRVLIW